MVRSFHNDLLGTYNLQVKLVLLSSQMAGTRSFTNHIPFCNSIYRHHWQPFTFCSAVYFYLLHAWGKNPSWENLCGKSERDTLPSLSVYHQGAFKQCKQPANPSETGGLEWCRLIYRYEHPGKNTFHQRKVHGVIEWTLPITDI